MDNAEIIEKTYYAIKDYVYISMSGNQEAIEVARQTMVNLAQEVNNRGIVDEYNAFTFKMALFERAMSSAYEEEQSGDTLDDCIWEMWENGGGINQNEYDEANYRHINAERKLAAYMGLIKQLDWETDYFAA